MAPRIPLGPKDPNRVYNTRVSPNYRGIIMEMHYSGLSYAKIGEKLQFPRSRFSIPSKNRLNKLTETRFFKKVSKRTKKVNVYLCNPLIDTVNQPLQTRKDTRGHEALDILYWRWKARSPLHSIFYVVFKFSKYLGLLSYDDISVSIKWRVDFDYIKIGLIDHSRFRWTKHDPESYPGMLFCATIPNNTPC